MLEYKTAKEALDKRYHECPVFCQHSDKEYDIDRSKFCRQCPLAKQKRISNDQLKEALQEYMGENDYDPEQLFSQIHRIANISELPADKVSVYSSYLIGEYLKAKHGD